MNKKLDTLHHTAIQVENIAESVTWYTENFNCDVTYQDGSWALLQFENTALALVLPSQHPYHFAIIKENIDKYGQAKTHRDQTRSVYIQDKDHNYIEILKLSQTESNSIK
ncbi:VOC family protein [Vibrio sp. SS-MA-C1-2]|uniref:VOC family protein n=1 Tax=Vibrio sp. SS-MA-C1-2 TaxID=2908646 RepID=UPI001F37843C|nr:VOC family protein [Vibrio sp. SS-MA-C1-2]UJF18344.1 VOC family protein [Vibrio sp. SS-MA-C1-2]